MNLATADGIDLVDDLVIAVMSMAAGQSGEHQAAECKAEIIRRLERLNEMETTRPAEVGGDGVAIVRVDSQGVSFGKYCWVSHEKITGYSAKSINEAASPTLKAYREWMQAALPPTPGSEVRS